MGGFAWSERERSILRKFYRKIGPTECAKLLPGRSSDTIQGQARALGLTVEGRRCGRNRKPNSWTEQELQVLRKNYATFGPHGMKILLPGRSVLSIRERARFQGLTVIGRKWKKFDNVWTEEEIEILTKSYIVFGPRACLSLLPKRSLSAIHARAEILGLTDPTRKRKWNSKINDPEKDSEASKKYGKDVYRFFLVGNKAFALVEKRDLRKLSAHRWYLLKAKHLSYACASIQGKTVLMHRFIMDAPASLEVDHWSGNGLDNVRKNIRLCNRPQNTWNRGATRSKRSSSYKGVFRRQKLECEKPWIARLCVNGNRIHLGYYSTAEAAALVVNKAIRKYHGKFARLNEV